MTDTQELQKNTEDEALEIGLEDISSIALARLIEEVRNDDTQETVSTTAYNRTYHRHNR